MSPAQSLPQHLQVCGRIHVDPCTQEKVCQAARQAGFLVATVDCTRARSRSAVLRAVVKAVDFPEFFGGDLEAFYECLCDTVLDQHTGLLLWFHRLHSGDPALQDDAVRIQGICDNVAEFAQNNRRIFVYVVDHAGCHAAPEPGVAPTPYTGSRV